MEQREKERSLAKDDTEKNKELVGQTSQTPAQMHAETQWGRSQANTEGDRQSNAEITKECKKKTERVGAHRHAERTTKGTTGTPQDDKEIAGCMDDKEELMKQMQV